MDLPLVAPGRDVEDSLVPKQELLHLVREIEGVPEVGDPLESHPLLDRQTQELVDRRHGSFLHPLLGLDGPHVVARDVLVRRPVRDSLPPEHGRAEELLHPETVREVYQESEPVVVLRIRIRSPRSVLSLARSLDRADRQARVFFDALDVLSPSLCVGVD